MIAYQLTECLSIHEMSDVRLRLVYEDFPWLDFSVFRMINELCLPGCGHLRRISSANYFMVAQDSLDLLDVLFGKF